MKTKCTIVSPERAPTPEGESIEAIERLARDSIVLHFYDGASLAFTATKDGSLSAVYHTTTRVEVKVSL